MDQLAYVDHFPLGCGQGPVENGVEGAVDHEAHGFLQLLCTAHMVKLMVKSRARNLLPHASLQPGERQQVTSPLSDPGAALTVQHTHRTANMVKLMGQFAPPSAAAPHCNETRDSRLRALRATPARLVTCSTHTALHTVVLALHTVVLCQHMSHTPIRDVSQAWNTYARRFAGSPLELRGRSLVFSVLCLVFDTHRSVYSVNCVVLSV